MVSVEGGRWDLETSLSIGGDEGKGELHLSGEGVVSVGEGTGPVFLENGLLRIGTGRVLAAGRISGDTRSELHFHHAEVRVWDATISGGMGVDHYGVGTTIVNGFNLHSGATNVFNGTLWVANELGSATGTGPVWVTRGETLAGSGAVLGEVTLGAGGTIRPAEGGLRLGNLVWTDRGSLTLGVGPHAAKLRVDGSLRKGEGNLFRIELTDEGAVIGETYTLVEFASTDFQASDFHVHGSGNLVVNETSLQWMPTGPPPPPSRSVTVDVRRGTGRSAIFTITNAGNVADQYHLRFQRRVVPEASGNGVGGNGTRRIICRYFLDGENISGAVERGVGTTRVLGAGEQVICRVRVDTRSPLKVRKRLVAGLAVASLSDTTVTGTASTGIRLDGRR